MTFLEIVNSRLSKRGIPATGASTLISTLRMEGCVVEVNRAASIARVRIGESEICHVYRDCEDKLGFSSPTWDVPDEVMRAIVTTI